MDTPLELSQDRSRRFTPFERGLAGAALVAIAGVWGLAFSLSPDPRGLGTHEQLGLPPCRMILFFDVPCAFCGMTTAFSHLAHGSVLRALQTQPAAVFFAALTLPAALAAGAGTVRGSLPRGLVGFLSSRRFFQAAAVVLLAAWLYKIAAYRGSLLE